VIAAEWIRAPLPASWGIARVRDHATVVNGYPFDSELFSTDTGIPLVRIRDISSDDTEVRYAGDVVREALIGEGDILIGMDGDFNVARWRGGQALLNQRVCCMRPASTVDARFLYYVLPAPLKLINEFTYSTTVKHLSSFDVLKIHFPFPPLPRQRAIADYLERETARLDALVVTKERVLRLLAEKRRALITRAITRGLEPRVPLRDSGIPWLGEIPASWEIERARWLFRERDRRSETGEEELLTVSHLTGVTPRSEKDVNMFEAETTEGYKICLSGDLVINTLWAWMGAMGVSSVSGIVSPAYNVYQPGARLEPGYVDSLVRLPVFAQEVTRYSKGVWSSRLRLYPEGFFEVVLPVPPLREQREIVSHVAREAGKLDELLAATERTIALLKERRAALVAAAVTGQVDVESPA
jgi:type I restriction enzyme S subunit